MVSFVFVIFRAYIQSTQTTLSVNDLVLTEVSRPNTYAFDQTTPVNQICSKQKEGPKMRKNYRLCRIRQTG